MLAGDSLRTSRGSCHQHPARTSKLPGFRILGLQGKWPTPRNRPYDCATGVVGLSWSCANLSIAGRSSIPTVILRSCFGLRIDHYAAWVSRGNQHCSDGIQVYSQIFGR